MITLIFMNKLVARLTSNGLTHQNICMEYRQHTKIAHTNDKTTQNLLTRQTQTYCQKRFTFPPILICKPRSWKPRVPLCSLYKYSSLNSPIFTSSFLKNPWSDYRCAIWSLSQLDHFIVESAQHKLCLGHDVLLFMCLLEFCSCEQS